MSKVRYYTLLLASSLLVSACDKAPEAVTEETPLTQIIRHPEALSATYFTPLPNDFYRAPTVTRLPLQGIGDNSAVWGATGSDLDGNIYVAVSSHQGHLGNAELWQLNPTTGIMLSMGDTRQNLAQIAPQATQNKLHSRILPASNGDVFFSSFDEQGESTSKQRNPTFGGHLWRMSPGQHQWQHVLAADQALIAINGNGRYIYALGYWQHVVYQFDTQTQRIRQLTTDSVQGHVSRQILVDHLGQLYVPRIETNPNGEYQAILQQYDTQLALVQEFPMPSYHFTKGDGHHGIIAYTGLADRSWVFTTSEGGLYRLTPTTESQPASLDYLGMMHPEGNAYIPSLFSFDGGSLIAGVTRADGQWQWLLHELTVNETAVFPLQMGDIHPAQLYGTMTKDQQGNFYLAGRERQEGKNQFTPLLLKLSFD